MPRNYLDQSIATKIFYSTFGTVNTPLIVSTSPVKVYGFMIGMTNALSPATIELQGTGNLGRVYATIDAPTNEPAAGPVEFLADDGLQASFPFPAAPASGATMHLTVFYTHIA